MSSPILLDQADIARIREVVLYLGTQVRKQRKSLNGLEKKFDEVMINHDAIEFDLAELENKLGITEEDYKKETYERQ